MIKNMDINKIIFHGNLEKIREIEQAVKNLPEDTIKKYSADTMATMDKDYLEVDSSGPNICQIKGMREIRVKIPENASSCVSDNTHTEFDLHETHYTIL